MLGFLFMLTLIMALFRKVSGRYIQHSQKKVLMGSSIAIAAIIIYVNFF
ncbi:hypothetical protein HBHAL_1864 [Halobacillus halophilus DSM 2266]|uniref:Uncharacterized protein n=1 Tax=Halobacillus halophilus (strain ATCC 35676 / DSM 2266 / JCM 20832 / KCTC 3685 / LMG 17431 / NBRC 102448 / NCIMB 2269) TaxID=866895 RepID=I0JJB0_HALH3|nr:hypothetical protein HBHAL_1864 [Halobacillus halophilus DSM 2266]